MTYRTEHDSMGEVQVPADRYWGAQTQRSCLNFRIGVGIETMPLEIIHAFGILKQAAARAKIADQYGFTDTRYALFYRQRILTAAEYRALIGTYSDHITIEESVRERFFDAIEETINRHGGSITIFDTIDLQLARKP